MLGFNVINFLFEFDVGFIGETLLRFVKFLFLEDERGEKKNFGKMR